MIPIRRPKNTYPTMYYHYSNPDSQGALIKETTGFPDEYNEKTQKYANAYTDRIYSWISSEAHKKARDLLGGGLCNPSAYTRQTDEELRKIAKIALGLEVTPEHVRIVHYYNVSSGFSCPLIETVYKQKRGNK